ncbi:putative uncharacterized protein [Firmicutes bacterium CAG:95]|nr:putative uncharacterized protein [Firmicutes bacterium CAG:95]
MIIDTVEISNLGLWENIFLKFDKGINIIQGENGAGKTTLLALLYSLFRDSGIIKFTNENQEAYTYRNMNILASRNRASGAVETYIPDTETAFDWLNYHS